MVDSGVQPKIIGDHQQIEAYNNKVTRPKAETAEAEVSSSSSPLVLPVVLVVVTVTTVAVLLVAVAVVPVPVLVVKVERDVVLRWHPIHQPEVMLYDYSVSSKLNYG